MNPKRLLLLLATLSTLASRAEIDVPSDGSDGDLVLVDTGTPRDVIIDLSLARDSQWNDPQVQPLQPDLGGVGVYDKEKWAVVFKYKSVRIDKNVTLSFKNHGSRAPVMWLVKGDVRIDGVVVLRGDNVGDRTAEPGPGGFRGSQWPTFH